MVISNKNFAIINYILAIIPFIFISFNVRHNINVFTIWSVFGLQLGSVVGLLLSRFIHLYGNKNALIFGGIIFIIFGVESFVVESDIMSSIMTVFTGFGYSVICYELLLFDRQNNIKNNKMAINILFIIFYSLIGLSLIGASLKLSLFVNKSFIFIIFNLFLISSVVIQKYVIKYTKKRLNIYILYGLLSASLWICAISNDFIILIFGLITLFLSISYIMTNRIIVLNNNSVMNYQMLIGFILSGLLFIVLQNYFSYYIIFIYSIILILYHFSFQKSL